MKISHIRISQFRQFRQAIDIGGLDPGINLFTGPNETGKSTIVAAIRAAFFERYRSNSVDDFRPWSDSSASPTVELEFDHDGQHYRLLKSFLGKKRCELQFGTRKLDGAEAEDYLADLMGFQHASKGLSKADHWGIPGLLWIQQGTAQNVRESVAHATDHLRTALNGSLGEVASSHGDEVIDVIESARNELLTGTTGKPRLAYQAALEKEALLAQALRQVQDEIATYRQKVDELARLRREHLADETEQPWLHFREQEKAKAKALESIQGIAQTLAEQRQRAGQVESRAALLRSQLDGYANEVRAVSARQAALAAALRAHETASALVEPWRGKLEETTRLHEAARDTRRQVLQEENRAALVRESDVIQRKVQDAANALTLAMMQQDRLLRHEQAAAAARIPAKDLQTLLEQRATLRDLRIRQSAAATRLRFALKDGHTIDIGGQQVSGDDERLLSEATVITLPGLGRLTIEPGGADLAQLRRQEAELLDRQHALLQRLGLPSAEAAEARAATHAAQLAEARDAAATLKGVAPHGIEALRSEMAAGQARAGEISQALGLLPAAPSNAIPAVSSHEAETAVLSLEQSLKQIGNELHAAQLAAGHAQVQVESARRELAAAQAVLDAPDRGARVDSANRELTDTLAEQSTMRARVEELVAQVAQARPDILRQDIDRFRKSAEQHENQFGQRRDMLVRLDVELQAAGAQGLEERHAELARDHAQAQRHSGELARRARALDYLLGLLRDKRSVLTARLQAPLQESMQRYVELLFPQARVAIDEDLMLGPLTRAGGQATESGVFDTLSFGAREQMGVISRLAYADLLRDAGRPTLIILDDVLVHSDEERLTQMKRVLFDAATRHQVLLFTCHPANWRDLGVAARPLEQLKLQEKA